MMATKYPWGDEPPMPPPVLGNLSPIYPHGTIPPMAPPARPAAWSLDRQERLATARQAFEELENERLAAIEQVERDLLPYWGPSVPVHQLVANAKRVRAALEQFDHDV